MPRSRAGNCTLWKRPGFLIYACYRRPRFFGHQGTSQIPLYPKSIQTNNRGNQVLQRLRIWIFMMNMDDYEMEVWNEITLMVLDYFNLSFLNKIRHHNIIVMPKVVIPWLSNANVLYCLVILHSNISKYSSFEGGKWQSIKDGMFLHAGTSTGQ